MEGRGGGGGGGDHPCTATTEGEGAKGKTGRLLFALLALAVTAFVVKVPFGPITDVYLGVASEKKERERRL